MVVRNWEPAAANPGSLRTSQNQSTKLQPKTLKNRKSSKLDCKRVQKGPKRSPGEDRTRDFRITNRKESAIQVPKEEYKNDTLATASLGFITSGHRLLDLIKISTHVAGRCGKQRLQKSCCCDAEFGPRLGLSLSLPPFLHV